MKILVLSDSHGIMRYMEQAVLDEKPDLVIHLGDRQRDAEELGRAFVQVPMLRVPGNCDGPFPGGEETLIRCLDGVRTMMTHGHRYGVKSGLQRAELAAREAGAGLLLFGHTHRALCEEHNGLWMLNPGACGGGYRVEYGIVLVENGKLACYNKYISE